MALNNFLSKYEHIILFGDFKLPNTNKHLTDFMTLFSPESFVNYPNGFQTKKPTCIDSILTNKTSLFKNPRISEAGIPDHH